MVFKHFLITRFNLRRNWGGIEETSPGITDKWMEKRFDIFENYTLPSIVNQTCLKFTWLIYIDILTSDYFKNKFYEIEKRYPFILPRFIDGYRAFQSVLNNDVVSEKEDSVYIITSRIDNDDCFHKEAMAAIQNSFVETVFLPLNLKKGFCLNIKTAHLAKYSHISSPFISLIEKFSNEEEVKTVFYREHQNYVKSDPIKHINNKAYWLQLIHGDNISNTMVGRPSFKYSYLMEFSLQKKAFKLNFFIFSKNLLNYFLSKLLKKLGKY